MARLWPYFPKSRDRRRVDDLCVLNSDACVCVTPVRISLPPILGFCRIDPSRQAEGLSQPSVESRDVPQGDQIEHLSTDTGLKHSRVLSLRVGHSLTGDLRGGPMPIR